MPKSLSRAATLLVVLSSGVASAKPAIVDRVAAVIEDDIITLRELETKAKPFLAQLEAVTDAKERATKRSEILHKVLDIEIGERIVGKELDANRERLGVTPADIDRAIEEVLRINKMTRERLQAALYTQGMTWTEYRKKLREQIERARLIQFKVQGKVQISPAEVKRRCLERQKGGASGEQVCASHVLLQIPDDATPDQIEMLHAKASKLQAELASGADFSAYALKFSADKGAPDGNLGCFGRGEMVDAFEKAAFATAVGDVSAVVRTEFGFHIIRVNERKAPPTPCDSQESLVPFQNEIYQEQLEQQMTIWIGELRKKAFVEVRL